MHAFHKSVGDNHVERSESEPKGRIFFFKAINVFLVLLPVDDCKSSEENEETSVHDGKVKLVLAEM